MAGVILLAASVAAIFIPAGSYSAIMGADDYCIVAPALPYDPASGVPMLTPKPVPAEARCPVCGMYPARFRSWAAQIVYKDGASHFFDSPVNLYVFRADITRYTSTYVTADISASYVTDLNSGAWIEVPAAWYVLGSKALGPMRDGNLPAFSTREAASVFASTQGGVIMMGNEITLDMLRPLIPSAHHH